MKSCDSKKKVLVIIPAFNEEVNIASVIQSIHTEYPNFDILVVNDDSIDKTGEIAEQTMLAKVIHLPINLGIGGCVQTGFKFAFQHNYDVAVQFDGDGQHLISELSNILIPILNKTADCVIGSRFIQDDESFRPSSFRMLGIKILRSISYLIIRQHIADQTSGFRAYSRSTIEFLAKTYPDHYPEPELIILLGKQGFKIQEVFTQMKERQGGISSIPLWKGPYYIIRVILAMFMANLRFSKKELKN